MGHLWTECVCVSMSCVWVSYGQSVSSVCECVCVCVCVRVSVCCERYSCVAVLERVWDACGKEYVFITVFFARECVSVCVCVCVCVCDSFRLPSTFYLSLSL